jgi:uncharacterized phiE125 gp8 family phage protein|tara:strand:- start:207 stop:803 length:597 start_codon:yes stop_codon:yes gene_type:complete
MYLDPNDNKQGDLVLVDNPATKVVSVTDIKAQLRIDSSDEDTLLGYYIDAATDMAENYCNRHFITHQYKLYFNEQVQTASLIFPNCTLEETGSNKPINWLDENGAAQSSDKAYIDAFSNPSLAYLSSDFPGTTLKDNAANTFYFWFNTGYGAASADVPEAIKQAIKLIVADMYYFREDRKRAFPMASQILLQPYKCYH